MNPRVANVLWIAAAAIIILFGLFTSGCAGPAPARITLPTTAFVQRPLQAAVKSTAAANQSNTRAIALASAAVRSGLAAGSDQAKQLAAATTATGVQLQQSLQQQAQEQTAVDTLSQQLLAKQASVDAVEKDDAAQTALVAKVEAKDKVDNRAKWHARELLVLTIIAAIAAISIAGAALQGIARAFEKYVAGKLLALGSTAVHVVEEIPKVAAVAALV